MPKEAVYIGLAGVTPYLATSLSTVFLAWNINHYHSTGYSIGMNGQTAEQLLHIIEPIQVGYGACVSWTWGLV